ncbi:(S)-2-haloacid dehalogenase 4A [Psilocybe cubensis]|uniref:Haloacid dehalogenase n=2 Tax=Psilocybe cubensis TaxID=181762 RepID=A0A8H7XWR6_PSICU|nr:(S)-2-haloacid dehalogenase 4A [Psilocybe cubensis]KAH9475811.1 (S)-2-haloacid dehalogenase 4A [Psilocybe cubensis]
MAPIEALLFDVFGTVVDWRGHIVAKLEAQAARYGEELAGTDWGKFTQDWWSAGLKEIGRIATGASQGPLNSDVLHRLVRDPPTTAMQRRNQSPLSKVLDEVLDSPEWSHVGRLWDETVRQSINFSMHQLNGWPDAADGLHELRKHTIVASLSNGNVRMLLDLSKFAGLPWDMIFSTEFFDTFKPNPKAYLDAARHLSLDPERCALVSAHIQDVRGAANVGMRTVYVRRPGEDIDESTGQHVEVHSKENGGDVDYMVGSFLELVDVIKRVNAAE